MIIFPPDGMEWRWNVFVGTAGNVGYPRCNLIRSQYVDKILAKPQKKTKEKQIKKKTMDKLRQVKKEKQQPTNKNVVKGRIQNNPWLCGVGNEIFGQNKPKRTTAATAITKIPKEKSEMKYSYVVSVLKPCCNGSQPATQIDHQIGRFHGLHSSFKYEFSYEKKVTHIHWFLEYCYNSFFGTDLLFYYSNCLVNFVRVDGKWLLSKSSPPWSDSTTCIIHSGDT